MHPFDVLPRGADAGDGWRTRDPEDFRDGELKDIRVVYLRMTRPIPILLLTMFGPLVLGAQGCTAGSSPPTVNAASGANDEREKANARALGEMGTAKDLRGVGRIAARELSEPIHGLSSTLRIFLEAASGERVFSDQVSQLIGAAFERDASLRSAFDVACNFSWENLKSRSMPEGERLAEVNAACKNVPPTEPSEKEPRLSLSVALSVGVEQLLQQRGGASELERRIARALVHLHGLDENTDPSSRWAVEHDERVVVGLRPSFHKCYREGPLVPGSLTISAHVRPDGHVEEAIVVNLKGLSQEVVDCLMNVVRAEPFAPAGGKGHTVNIPLKFVPHSAP